VTDHPLKPVRCHCLGRLLSYQLADTIQSHPKAINISLLYLCAKGVWSISSRFQLLFSSLGQINYILLTRAPLSLQSKLGLD